MRALVLVAALTGLAAPEAAGAPHRELRRWPAENVIYHSEFRLPVPSNDVWGYTAPDGREYALLGAYDGMAVIDISDRGRPRQTGYFYGPESTWRDVKTYGHWAYMINESDRGMWIVNLEDPEHPYSVAPYQGFLRAHNIYVDEEAGLLFTAGEDARPGIGGTTIYSLEDPTRPRPVATWNASYVHDVYAADGVMYLAAIYDRALYIVDISNLPQLTLIGTISRYPDAFTHNAWATDDGRHVLTTDESAGARVRMWDIADPAQPVETDSFGADAPGAQLAIPHNVLVDGHLAYVSYYTTGVRVVDLSDPEDCREVAWYDTHLATNGAAFHGAWGVFPYYPQSPDLFVVSDIEHGLFVLELESDGAAPAPRRPAAARQRAPEGVRLGPGVPNPRRSGREIRWTLAGSPGRARVVDVAGRLVRELPGADSGAAPAALTWDGRDRFGRPVAAGTYFLRVETPGRELSRRLTVLR